MIHKIKQQEKKTKIIEYLCLKLLRTHSNTQTGQQNDCKHLLKYLLYLIYFLIHSMIHTNQYDKI